MNKSKRAAARLAQGGFVLPSPHDVARAATRSPSGNEGWSAIQLAEWGVPWPPPKGWRQALADRWKADRWRDVMSEVEPPLSPNKGTDVSDLFNRASDVVALWQAFRLYPDQNYVAMCAAMRKLDDALEALEPTEAAGKLPLEWNAAIEAVHRLVNDAAGGRGPLWRPFDGEDVPDAGMVLDRLPNAIWDLRREAAGKANQ